MRDDLWPWILVGGGALAVAHAWPLQAHAGRREVEAARVALAEPIAPAAPLFELGRPTPADVRSIMSSGWSSARGNHLHRALDIPLPVGTPIVAIDDGEVLRVRAKGKSDAGLWVGVRHPSGLSSRYLHLSRPLVQVGQTVRRGDVIGESGNTGNSAGPHLHLDLWAPAEMLATIERAIGAPPAGWGPRSSTFGHKIPGEPWIPVDGYRESVRREAATFGIPLHGAQLRNASFTYRPVGDRGEPYPDWLRALRGRSGVYVIRDRRSREIVYVGESSASRLYETLTRHFSSWRRYKGFWRGQYAGGADPGLTYPRGDVEVAVRVTSPAEAIDEEARLIRRLRPRDNQLGQPETEPVPF